jgi:flagellin-specific chaperone FliS
MSNKIEQQEAIIHFLAREYDLNLDTMRDIMSSISLSNDKLNNETIKKIFKILINYTYKIKKSEIALNEKYEQNFNEINEALKELKKEMKKIIKEEPSPTETTPSAV